LVIFAYGTRPPLRTSPPSLSLFWILHECGVPVLLFYMMRYSQMNPLNGPVARCKRTESNNAPPSSSGAIPIAFSPGNSFNACALFLDAFSSFSNFRSTTPRDPTFQKAAHFAILCSALALQSAIWTTAPFVDDRYVTLLISPQLRFGHRILIPSSTARANPLSMLALSIGAPPLLLLIGRLLSNFRNRSHSDPFLCCPGRLGVEILHHVPPSFPVTALQNIGFSPLSSKFSLM